MGHPESGHRKHSEESKRDRKSRPHAVRRLLQQEHRLRRQKRDLSRERHHTGLLLHRRTRSPVRQGIERHRHKGTKEGLHHRSGYKQNAFPKRESMRQILACQRAVLPNRGRDETEVEQHQHHGTHERKRVPPFQHLATDLERGRHSPFHRWMRPSNSANKSFSNKTKSRRTTRKR